MKISMRLILTGHCPLSPVASCEHYFNLNRAPSTSKRRVDQGSSGVGKVVSSSSWQGGPEDKPVAGEYTCNCN